MMIPIINYLKMSNIGSRGYNACQKVDCIVVAPTRELATQLYDECYKFCGRNTNVVPGLCYGGTGTREQSQRIREGCNIVIGTPGRLKDFLEKGVIDASEAQFLVLDEADRMLDQGFGPDIREINAYLPPKDTGKRTTALFSATFELAIQRAAQDYLRPNYIFVAIGIIGGANTAVTQQFEQLQKREKFNRTVEICKQNQGKRTLIFVATKIFADSLGSMLVGDGIKATTIHGDRQQRDREQAINDLKANRMHVLVATDVAARGIDIDDVEVVINFDFPKELESYIHRIGRTARKGKKGLAITFIDAMKDRQHASSLVKICQDAKQTVPPFLQQMAGGGGGGFGGFGAQSDQRQNNAHVMEQGQSAAAVGDFVPDAESEW